MHILAGDIGGTKTQVGLFDPSLRDGDGRDAPRLVQSARYPSADHRGLEAIVADFLDRTRDHHGGDIAAAAFGIAGPVLAGRVESTNLPWTVDATDLGDRFDIPRVALLNDLQATGAGIDALRDDELVTLQEGKTPPPDAAACLLAAGTGMGMALLFPADGRWKAQPTEGGHVDLAPQTRDQLELIDYLFDLYPDHVSVERAVCGPGLVNLYRYVLFRGRPRGDEELERLVREDADDAPQLIADAAMAGLCPASEAALDLFCDLYGAVAGNLALTALARGGVFLGGGIAPKILPRLKQGAFLKAFRRKGRFASLMASIPVRVILNPETAVLGAAREAEQSLANQ